MKTLGELYKELILSQKDLEVRELEGYGDRFRIDKDLHGWMLWCEDAQRPSRKEQLRCRSEEEARYLKCYFEVGLRRIKIPRDEAYLKEILPRLERQRRAIDDYLEEHTDGILNRTTRRALLSSVWQDLLKECHEDNDKDDEEEVAARSA